MQPLEFRLFAIPVVVQPQFLLLLGLYGLFGVQRGEPAWQIIAWWAIVFGSILLHELGHAGMARLWKVPVHGIRLHGFGGEVSRAPSGPGSSLAISLSGPGAGLLFGGALLGVWLYGLLGDSIYAEVITSQLLWVNLGWSVINLLPMRPLDGGNALLAGLFLIAPSLASPVTHGLGLLCALAMVGFGVWGNEPFLLLFGGTCAWVNASALGIFRSQE